MTQTKNMNVHTIFDPDSHTFTYIVWDSETKKSAVIDSVLDYNHKNITTSTTHADEVIAYILAHELTNEWILETHIHADHISASDYIKNKIGGKKAIGNQIIGIQKYIKDSFVLNDHFKIDGSQFDHLFADKETFMIGTITAKALHTPGHTPADTVYAIGDTLFLGDTLLAPDIGTARCDFPGGNAGTMYDSVRTLLETFPEETPLYLCHDYPDMLGRDRMHTTTVKAQRATNIHIKDGISKDEFVTMRAKRDATLDLPTYIFPSVQINGNSGSLVTGEFIKLPYNKKVF